MLEGSRSQTLLIRGQAWTAKASTPRVSARRLLLRILREHPEKHAEDELCHPADHEQVEVDRAERVDLLQADVHRLLVVGGFLTDAPAQVDGLEASAIAHAQLSQAQKDSLLQGIPFSI